jgi:hypothetical protein
MCCSCPGGQGEEVKAKVEVEVEVEVKVEAKAKREARGLKLDVRSDRRGVQGSRNQGGECAGNDQASSPNYQSMRKARMTRNQEPGTR